MPVEQLQAPMEAPPAGIPPTAVLHPAARTAARELERQRALAGRSTLGVLLGGLALRIRGLGTEEAAKDGLRYQPVIWTVIAIVAIAFFFPGRGGDDEAGALASAPAASVPFVPTSTPFPVGVATASPTTRPFVPPTPVAAASVTTVARAVSGGVRPAPTPPLSPLVTSAPATTTPAPVPLTISGWGWAGTTGSTSVGPSPVPEGTLPVANRLGGVDKVSFIRLSGTATMLTIAENLDGAQEALGPAAVKLCKIDEADWEETPGQSMADAPTWSDTCVAGVETDNAWTFDLSGLGDPTSREGFALVPGDSAPADFQVTFEP